MVRPRAKGFFAFFFRQEFEYLVCSLSFFGGLVCFISATLCRVIVATRLTSQGGVGRVSSLPLGRKDPQRQSVLVGNET